MADDEQFSLCWNNFNSNLSAGFHESLCRGDLVDVTLAAEGQFVKAHRLVLSVCSPYFRRMFTQMPANQHAFVFLKDVSHTALKDLIQFMYCGEVNVKQEALPAFISTAEALQIKGLTDSDPPQSQTPPEPSTPTPQIQQIQSSPRVRQRTSTARSYKIETVDDSGDDAKQTTQIVIQTTAPTHPPQATITTQPQQQQQQQQQHHQTQHITQQQQQQQHQQPLHTQTHQLTSVSMPTVPTATVVTQKRPAQRTSIGSSVPHIKRSKSTIDPIEAAEATAATHQINVQTTVVADPKPQVQQQHHQQQQQQQQQQQHQQQTHHHQQQQAQQQQQQTNEPEYIDLPIELPTKSEPDYAEDTGEVDQTEQDATYVEDESYGDMRYDESYFTENEDAAATGATTTGGSAQNTSAAAATTSKAIVKQQPLSDSSYMDTSGDPGNSDAQDVSKPQDSFALLLEASANAARVPIKPRGRPKKDPAAKIHRKTPPKLLNKIIEAVNNHSGQPVLYASTTKGTMKLIVDGHHFRYSFRKGKYTIFQCCYKENKEECTVRVVTDQKLVYPLDGEHIHFMAATDKSVTSIKFSPGEEDKESEFVTIAEQSVETPQQQQQQQHVDDSYPVFIQDDLPQPIKTNVKFENISSQDSVQHPAESSVNSADVAQPGTVSADAFREKIKRRLQKALLGKKK